MEITHLALNMLAMIVSSCRTFDAKKVDNLKYVISQAQSGEDFDWKEYLSGLPEKSRMYDYIDGFMRIKHKELIDERAILEFFGGIDHIQFTLDQINGLLLRDRNENFAAKYLFAHMLVPIEINSAGPLITGKYMVDGREVRVKGLIAHPLGFPDAHVKQHAVYMCHFSTIIAPASKEVIDWVRREHLKSHEFMRAMSEIGVVDYRNFWAMHEWTKDMLAECGF